MTVVNDIVTSVDDICRNVSSAESLERYIIVGRIVWREACSMRECDKEREEVVAGRAGRKRIVRRRGKTFVKNDQILLFHEEIGKAGSGTLLNIKPQKCNFCLNFLNFLLNTYICSTHKLKSYALFCFIKFFLVTF